MRKIGLILTMAVVLSLVTLSFSWAATAYVKNGSPINAIPTAGNVYVSLADFLRAGGYSWNVAGAAVTIADGTGGGANFPSAPITSFSYKGKTFSAHTFVMAGKQMVMAQSLAAGLGLITRYDKTVDAYDFFTPGTTPPSHVAATTGPTPTPTGSPTPKKEDKTPKFQTMSFKDAEISKSAVQPNNQFFFDFRTGEVRGGITFANNSSLAASNVSALMKIVDGDGSVLWSNRYQITSLAPQARSESFDFYWLNPSKFDVFDNSFKYEINYTQATSTATTVTGTVTTPATAPAPAPASPSDPSSTNDPSAPPDPSSGGGY